MENSYVVQYEAISIRCFVFYICQNESREVFSTMRQRTQRHKASKNLIETLIRHIEEQYLLVVIYVGTKLGSFRKNLIFDKKNFRKKSKYLFLCVFFLS